MNFAGLDREPTASVSKIMEPIIVVDADTEDRNLRQQLKFLYGETPVVTFSRTSGLLEYFSQTEHLSPRLILVDAAAADQETVEALRGNPKFAAVPVILTTSNRNEGEITALEKRAKAGLHKPVRRRDLLEILSCRAGPAPDMVAT